MAERNTDQAPVFDHNPDIAAEIEREKGEHHSDSDGSTKAGESPHGDEPVSKEKAEIDGDERVEITEEDCYDELGYSYPSWKKWYVFNYDYVWMFLY